MTDAPARDFSIPSILFLDLETSGLYLDKRSAFDPAQPWAMACAAMLCNEAGIITNAFTHIIKADGRTTKENALKVHGITAQATARIGVPEPRVLGMLADMLKTAPVQGMRVVTYGDFDARIIGSLFSRFGESQGKPTAYDRLWTARPGTQFIDLLKPWCQQACKLPSGFETSEFKWPTLDESAEIILGRPPRTGAHDAWEDMLILRDLYFHFQRAGIFQREAA